LFLLPGIFALFLFGGFSGVGGGGACLTGRVAAARTGA